MSEYLGPVQRAELLFRPVDAVASGWDPVWCWPSADEVPSKEEFLELVDVDDLPDGHYRTLALTSSGRRDRLDPDHAFEFEVAGDDVQDPYGGERGTRSAGLEVVQEEGSFGGAVEPDRVTYSCQECGTGYEEERAAASCCKPAPEGG